jgi:3-oxoacyl-[acyl-carrier-protein] synthase II
VRLGTLAGRPVEGLRVAITGVGAVSCFGLGASVLFDRLLDPEPPESRTVPAFDTTHLVGPKELRRLDPFALYAVAAADEAWRQAGLPEKFDDGASIIATGIGGLQTMIDQLDVMRDKGPSRVSPFMIPMMMPNAGAAAVSLRFGLRGPCETITTACAAGTHAIGHAARLVASGRVTLAAAGGAEAVVVPVAQAGFANMTALSSSGVSRPFDVERDGFVMGEGAGVLILEEFEHAQRRGAFIIAEVVGAASSADAFHITAPEPTGAGARDCMTRALEDAGVSPDEVDHLNAHGTSTPLNDLAESLAVRTVFGDRAIPTTSVKGHLGHSLAAAGALEGVVTALTLDRQVAPPTSGTENIDPDISLDVVYGEARKGPFEVALSNSFGFGGHNGTVVLRRVSP